MPSGRCLPSLLLWTLGALLTSPGVTAQYYKDFFCPQSPFWGFLSVSQDPWCYSLMNPMTFEDASAYCLAHQAELFLINPNSRASPRLPSGTDFTKFLAMNGVNKMWHGVYVKNGYLQKYYRADWSPRFNINSTRREFAFSEPTGTSDCFEVFLNETECIKPSRLKRASDFDAAVKVKRRSRRSHGKVRSERRSRWSANKFEAGHRSRRGLKDVESKRRSRRSQGEVKLRTARQTFVDGFSDVSDCTADSQQINSRPCQQRLPFVCVKPALRKYSSSLETLETLCEPDEFGNYKLARCISFGRESVNFKTARQKCRNKGEASGRPRTLYRPLSQASSTYLNGLVVDVLRRNFNFNNNFPGVSIDDLAWVDQPLDSTRNECLALILDPRVNGTVAWDCDARLPFYVCQHYVNLPVLMASKLTLNVLNVPGAQTTRIPRTNDVQVSVPYKYTVMTSNPNHQNRPTSPKIAVSCTYSAPAVWELQTMTLVRGGRELGRSNSPNLTISRELGLEYFPAFSGLEEQSTTPSNRLTDYYWCELNDLRTGQIRQSGRVFLRAQEVEIYAASVVVTNAQEFPTNADLILNTITDIESGGVQNQLNKAFGAYSGGLYNYRLLRARPKLNGNKTILDFHIFKKPVGGTAFIPTGSGIVSARRELTSDLKRFANDTDFVFNLETLAVRSIDICPAMSLYDPISDKTYKIRDTDLGQSFVSPGTCLSDGEPYVNLKCRGNKLYGAFWTMFQPNAACNFSHFRPSPVTPTLKNISESTINEKTLKEVLKNTTDALKRIDLFSPVDVVYFADIVQQITNIPDISVEEAEEILGLVETVSNADDTILEDSNRIGNATNRILRSVDALGDKIIIADDAPKVRVVKDQTALEVWDLTQVGDDDVIIGLELQQDQAEDIDTQDIMSLFEDTSPDYKETEAAIFLSSQFIRSIISNSTRMKNARLSMNVFADTRLFRLSGRSSNQTVLNSKVISAKVTVNGQPVLDLGDYVVTTVFRPVKEPESSSRAANTTCVFWDFSGSQGQGAWSEEGCRYSRTVEGKDVCVCDHLTNFAVLLDFYGQQSPLAQEHQLALSIITIVGLSLSIFGLSITVISFLLIKKLRQGLPQQTLFNMALAMLASWITFLAGFTRTEDHTACVAVAALLHYFILASFMWMLMEGMLQYLLFVKVLGNDFDNYMIKTAIPAWGLPLIPVIVLLAVDTDLYRGGEQYCWMSLTPFYYAFLAPVVLVMVVNIVVYVMVTVNITRRSKATTSSTNRQALGIKASVACFIVLGLSWLFAFFAIDDARVVFQYLFTITSTLQGFLIFLVFTLRDPKVRDYWRDLICRRGGAKKARTSATPNGTSGSGDRANKPYPPKQEDSDSAYYSTPKDFTSSNMGSDSRVTPPTSPTSLSTSSSGGKYKFENPTYE